MNVIQFPRARALQPRASEAMPAGWPDGQVGIELDGLARLIQDRGQRIGKPCTLNHARRCTLAALHGVDAATRPPTPREARETRIAQLLVDRAQRAGIDLEQVVTNTGSHEGSDPTLQRIMAATQNEAKARIARSKQ